MRRSFQLLLICLTLFATSAFAQEVCNNGIDDDTDGFIDCFDSGCATDPLCDDFYLGNDAVCQSPPVVFPKFTMELDFASPDETTNSLSRMAIGDLNQDGVPEIVTMNRYTKRLFVLNGSDGSVQTQTTVTWEPYWEIAIANIDSDACAEIFFIGDDDPSRTTSIYLYAYDCNLNFLWKSAKLPGDPINYGVADFDGDGRVEIYAKDEIYDAKTGVRIVKTTGGTYSRINGGPVAVDMDNDNKLELVIGLSIYKVNLGARTLDAGSLTVFKSRPEYFVRNEFNATSVADYDLDGNLDVIASGSTIANGTNTTAFFWNVTTNTLKTYSDPILTGDSLYACPTVYGTFYTNGWKNGTGRINLADLDGDGRMNASYVSGKYLYALDENFNQLWRTTVNEETSGYTGCTLFDFNGDGKSEIVYRDEKFIYIIDGTTGIPYNSPQPCVSRTNREYPIVADVDADGSTEICVTCGFDDANALNNFCNLGYSRYSHVRVFKSASEPWVPARRLWNQHGYFNVNVNNDLTIPTIQQKHHNLFSTAPCKPGDPITENRPLNSFLNQSPFLDSRGCTVYASPNLAFVDNSLFVDQPTCPEKNFTVRFQLTNLGDVPLSGDVPITFYSGDPRLAGAIKLNTTTVTLNGFSINQIFNATNIPVIGLGSAFTLYVVLNDDGSTVPTPIKLPNTNFLECLYTDNILPADVVPIPVPITPLIIQENIVCSPSPSPPNGAVRAFILTAGLENTIDYNFYWSNGASALPIPANFIGPVYSGLVGGDYTVFAIHKTANCGSLPATVSLNPSGQPNTISVSINLLSDDTNCQTPNGSLQAVVSINGVVQPVNDFTYQWFDGPFVITGPLIGVADIVANLKGGKDYAVLVKEKATGCEGSLPFFVPDNTAKPVAQATVVDIVCSSANSGSAAATVDVSGVPVTAGFTFNWYRGSSVKPTTDFPAPAFTSTATGIISNQPAGFYTVVAVNNVTLCESIPVIVEIKQTPPFVVSVTKTSDQTSCDMTQLNGAAFATPSTGAIADYTFEWFRGQNTLPLNFIDSTSNTIAGLDVGIYTVRAKHRTTKCTDTEEVTINFAVVNPIIQTTAQGSSSKCSPPDGTAEVTALSMGTFSDYTFEWYNGSIVDPATLMADTDEKITGLTPGDYTVKATNNITHCVTPPKTITVGSIISLITINQTAIKNPDKCDEFGFITISASAPGNTLGFDFIWHKGNAPFQALPATAVVASTTTSSTLSQILTGGYTVEVINRETGCSSTRYSPLLFSGGQILFPDVVTDITTCDPGTGGIVSVQLVKSPSVAFESDYDIYVYKGTNDDFPASEYRIIPGVNGKIAPYELMDNLPSDPLLPGFYTFVAVLKLDGCRSEPLTMELKSNTLNPVFTSVITDNFNCSPGINPLTGQIVLTISPPIAPDPITTPADYDFVWSGPTATSPVLPGITTNLASNLGGGIYTVNVKTKTGLLYAGCTTTQTFQVFDRAPIVSMAVTIIPKTDCLLPAAAGASVLTILENGVNKFPPLSADYPATSFQWFDNTQTLIPTGIGSSISGLIPSTYSVRATNANNNCFTEFGFEIIDETIGDINVDLLSSINPTRCLLPINTDGDLLVNAVDLNDPAATYTYDWYDGIDLLVPPILSNDPHLTGRNVAPGQTAITFTVKAIKNSTQCFATSTYTLPLETAPILLTASANPVTNCAAPLDGAVFATITNGNQNLYTYTWTDATGGTFPGFPTAPVSGLDSGTYIVRASQADLTCFAEATVTIANDRIFPNLLLETLRSLSVCDLMVAPADGVAQASIEGDDVINYEIDWFRNGFPTVVNPILTPSPFAFGSQVGSLADSTYYVVAFDLVSRCLDSAKIKIPFVPLPIPFPQIEPLSMVTSCVENNGALAVSVAGNTRDYIFDWTGPNFAATGEMIDSLAIGTYTVTATSRITGCVSVPVSQDVTPAPVYPDFNFKVEPATCDSEDGYLTLFMTTNINIATIVWTSGANTYTGPNVTNAPAGDYTVVVTSELGCETTKSVTLLTEIKPYNGISRNGDGKNDFFLIDCIQNFENNVVKIFNRAGTLVYEASGYNNTTTLFDGVSNKGISMMGTKLPDGTYFYVIDKQDGSKAVAGYLEIVN